MVKAGTILKEKRLEGVVGIITVFPRVIGNFRPFPLKYIDDVACSELNRNSSQTPYSWSADHGTGMIWATANIRYCVIVFFPLEDIGCCITLPPHNKGLFDSHSYLFSSTAIVKKLAGKELRYDNHSSIRWQMLTISSAVSQYELKIKFAILSSTRLFDATSPYLFRFTTCFLIFHKSFDLLLLSLRWSRLDIFWCGC